MSGQTPWAPWSFSAEHSTQRRESTASNEASNGSYRSMSADHEADVNADATPQRPVETAISSTGFQQSSLLLPALQQDDQGPNSGISRSRRARDRAVSGYIEALAWEQQQRQQQHSQLQLQQAAPLYTLPSTWQPSSDFTSTGNAQYYYPSYAVEQEQTNQPRNERDEPLSLRHQQQQRQFPQEPTMQSLSNTMHEHSHTDERRSLEQNHLHQHLAPEQNLRLDSYGSSRQHQSPFLSLSSSTVQRMPAARFGNELPTYSGDFSASQNLSQAGDGRESSSLSIQPGNDGLPTYASATSSARDSNAALMSQFVTISSDVYQQPASAQRSLPSQDRVAHTESGGNVSSELSYQGASDRRLVPLLPPFTQGPLHHHHHHHHHHHQGARGQNQTQQYQQRNLGLRSEPFSGSPPRSLTYPPATYPSEGTSTSSLLPLSLRRQGRFDIGLTDISRAKDPQVARDMLRDIRARLPDLPTAPAACDFCRRRKIKCNREKPTCDNCRMAGRECTTEDVLRKRGPPSKKEKQVMEDAGITFRGGRHKKGTRGRGGLRRRGLSDSYVIVTEDPEGDKVEAEAGPGPGSMATASFRLRAGWPYDMGTTFSADLEEASDYADRYQGDSESLSGTVSTMRTSSKAPTSVYPTSSSYNTSASASGTGSGTASGSGTTTSMGKGGAASSTAPSSSFSSIGTSIKPMLVPQTSEPASTRSSQGFSRPATTQRAPNTLQLSPEVQERSYSVGAEDDIGSSASEGDEIEGPGQHRAGQRGSSVGRDKAVERQRRPQNQGQGPSAH